jgi:RNA polymerase sigma-70 factor (ECF subfamily)
MPWRDRNECNEAHPVNEVKRRTLTQEEQWAAWMIAARAGDENAYRRLLSNLSTRLRSLVKRSVMGSSLSAQDAEDVVQETLIAVHVKRHTWREDAPFTPWLNAILRYKVIDAIRRRGGRVYVHIDTMLDVLVAEQNEPELLKQDIDKMTAHLSEKQRAVLKSMFLEGHSAAETAEQLEMTETSVRVTLHRALGKLAREFGNRD